MHNLIEANHEEIVQLCRQFGVRKLTAFGSILRDDFDPERSDADFLVEFDSTRAALRMRNYIGLREALGSLLRRPVDLVEAGAIRNPYVLHHVAAQEHVLYAA